ncbi:hypothetical protein [Ktedonosporobacter rubrisoli]|nr:hypothetical protein [Ktedonosporobacter rubrisoli]
MTISITRRQVGFIQFAEEDQDGTTANGAAKHLHVYHIIAGKP